MQRDSYDQKSQVEGLLHSVQEIQGHLGEHDLESCNC